jgi:(S)-ureidoglycine aminohydrolase
VSSADGATVLMYEQRYVEPVGAAASLAAGSRPQLRVGSTEAQPLLPVDGEVFGLRKLLPTSAEYDFNMHVMTFEPGEFLTVKEVHYNQHGLLLLEGQGVYRLADKWCGRAWERTCVCARRREVGPAVVLNAAFAPPCTNRYPVKAGDAIWMAPYVVQWYGALGKTRSRYIINKDTNRALPCCARCMRMRCATDPPALNARQVIRCSERSATPTVRGSCRAPEPLNPRKGSTHSCGVCWCWLFIVSHPA